MFASIWYAKKLGRRLVQNSRKAKILKEKVSSALCMLSSQGLGSWLWKVISHRFMWCCFIELGCSMKERRAGRSAPSVDLLIWRVSVTDVAPENNWLCLIASSLPHWRKRIRKDRLWICCQRRHILYFDLVSVQEVSRSRLSEKQEKQGA